MKKYCKKYLKADITDIRFIQMWARERFYELYVLNVFNTELNFKPEWNKILDALDKENIKLNIVIKK